MTQSEVSGTSALFSGGSAVNDQVFSPSTNSAVTKIISLAEVRTRCEKINRETQWAAAFVREVLGSLGIEMIDNIANDAAELVRLRALNATNDESSAERKAA